MYWLLDYAEQENLRQRMIRLQSTILNRQPRDQSEQIFPFIGRKSRTIARTLIENLTDENAVVVDPFGGSGTFAYAALDAGRHVLFNEWEPYAYKMSTAPFRGVPDSEEYCASLRFITQRVEPTMNAIYKTRCPNCGTELSFDGLFFDRDPLEYYHPTPHERLGANGENVIFRNRRYRCHCGCTEKHYDDFDEAVRLQVEAMPCDFPNVELIENSRLNFTAPQYTAYQNLFSKRQQIALMTLKNAIAELPESTRTFFEDTLISITHCGKYTDYRSKSQDNHCPENRLKETNLYHRFLEKLEERKTYIATQNFDLNLLEVSSMDYRSFLHTILPNTVNLLLTDPPYGDNAQYFEHAQRVHPIIASCWHLQRQGTIFSLPQSFTLHCTGVWQFRQYSSPSSPWYSCSPGSFGAKSESNAAFKTSGTISLIGCLLPQMCSLPGYTSAFLSLPSFGLWQGDFCSSCRWKPYTQRAVPPASDNLLGTPAGACRILCQRKGHFRMSHTGAGFPSSLFY